METGDFTALLDPAIRVRRVAGVNGLDMQILEAGFEDTGRPTLLLLHGFPEIAYSWRRVMPKLAEAGYHVVAPDLRGYGWTTGWDGSYDGDVASFGMLNLVADCVALLHRLEKPKVRAVIGHDFGSPLAAFCALIRPDIFSSAILMSAPFAGPPAFPVGEAAPAPEPDNHAALAALERPRKHYQWYYSTRKANDDMLRCDQGLSDFLRAYFHVKSADWPGNDPHPLPGGTAQDLAVMPTYYIMDAGETMAETVAPHMPDAATVAACDWLTEADLTVYTQAYGRTGYQGGLNWYRNMTSDTLRAPLRLFSGKAIEVPVAFVGGEKDWGVYQVPGALERMAGEACADYRGTHLVPGAGHWVQQEQPGAVVETILGFLRETDGTVTCNG